MGKFKTLEEFYKSEPEKSYASRIKSANQSVFRSLRQHAMQGRSAGSFVNHALCNNFERTVSKADRKMRHHLVEIATYLSICMPNMAWGSKDAVRVWRKEKGLVGKYGEEKALEKAERCKL